MEALKNKYIGVLDIGTTSVRFIIFHLNGHILFKSSKEIKQIYPRPGWVEEDPGQIWEAAEIVINDAISKGKINKSSILALGITNQRESVVLWDKNTGRPCTNLIVWQDRRTAKRCRELKNAGYENIIKEKTGLTIDPYFSATKIEWLLKNNPEIKSLENTKKLAFGTVDSYIIYKLTGNHLTDYSNASRTLLFNISKLCWDDELLDIFNIDKDILPRVLPCYGNAIFGVTKKESAFGGRIPICSVFGDQQGALFGQRCFSRGEIKSTFGTGSFIMQNTGREKVISKNGLLSTIFYGDGKDTYYALEGSIYNAGSIFQWFKEGPGIIDDYDEIEKLAKDINYQEDLFVVPALTGLGAPYWDPYARGMIIGINRATSRGEIIRAAIESIGFRTADVLEAMAKDIKMDIKKLKIDGGVSKNRLFCQVLADITGASIIKFDIEETTSLGAMYGAGLGTGIWDSVSDIKEDMEFENYLPKIDIELRNKLYRKWKKAIEKVRNWSEEK
ncbi:MAG TPA: glycerol kinase [Actinobacteria bacterium]|nr:glycerol kinase [Actinomycetota bacterium]